MRHPFYRDKHSTEHFLKWVLGGARQGDEPHRRNRKVAGRVWVQPLPRNENPIHATSSLPVKPLLSAVFRLRPVNTARGPASLVENWEIVATSGEACEECALIEQHCTNALNILDRFHIVAKLNLALDEVRASESRRLVQDGYEPVLKKSRWCLLKRRTNLTQKQRVKLRDVLRYNLQSVRAYLFKEYFQQFWDYDSPTWAGKFLDQWCTEVMRSRIEPLKKFVRTVRNHREPLLNYFRARKAFSSGIVEGLNNKAKVTTRKAYGFRTFKMLELALYHVLGKLPEPTLTHSFY
jgi:transposase